MIRKILKLGSLELWNRSVDAMRQRHELTNLFWECTLKCNFSCKHCGSSAGESSYPDELTTTEIKKTLLLIAKDFDPHLVFLSVTGGEPLIRSDLFEVMSFAKKIGFEWGMVSNGFLVDENSVKKMKESGMSSLVISIDGMDDVHDSFRNKKGSFSKALSAIRMVAGENFLKELNITSTIHKKNITQLEDMYLTFKNLGITSWRLTNIDPIGRAKANMDLMLSGQELKKMLQFIWEKRKRSSVEVMYDCSGFLGHKFEGEVRRSFFMCPTGINIGSILANGDIFVCPNVPRRKELIQGNVRKDSFKAVWDNKFELFRNKKRTECADCAKCESWNNCLGNAMHLWDFDENKPKMCHLKMIEED